jgi:hypothetical protein
MSALLLPCFACVLQLWEARRLEVIAMPDARIAWGPEEQQQAEQLLCTLASLLAPLGPELNLPPTTAGIHSSMKVRAALSSVHMTCTCLI